MQIIARIKCPLTIKSVEYNEHHACSFREPLRNFKAMNKCSSFQTFTSEWTLKVRMDVERVLSWTKVWCVFVIYNYIFTI